MVDPDALVTAVEAVEQLPVSRITIRGWAHRGWIGLDGNRRYLEAVDHDGPRGAARYRWRDIAEAERDTRKNPRSPGRRVLVTV